MKAFVTHAAPILVGLQLPVTGRWLFSPTAGELLALALGGVLAFFVAVLALSKSASLLVLFLVISPFIYGVSPFTWYWNDGRYALFFAPLVALLVVAAADHLAALLASRRASAPTRGGGSARGEGAGVALCLCLAAALSGWAIINRPPFPANNGVGSPQRTWTSWTPNANGYVGALAAGLVANGQHDLYSGYWVGYLLDFESGGAITATDARYSRYPPILAEVEAAKDPGWLFVQADRRPHAAPFFESALLDPGCAVPGNDRCIDAREFGLYLTSKRIASRSIELGDFVVVIPARPVDPEAVFRTFGVGSAKPL